MTSKIDALVKQAYQSIDQSQDFQIPKFSKMAGNIPAGRKLLFCKACGAPYTVQEHRGITAYRCKKCAKRAGELYKKRTQLKSQVEYRKHTLQSER